MGNAFAFLKSLNGNVLIIMTIITMTNIRSRNVAGVLKKKNPECTAPFLPAFLQHELGKGAWGSGAESTWVLLAEPCVLIHLLSRCFAICIVLPLLLNVTDLCPPLLNLHRAWQNRWGQVATESCWHKDCPVPSVAGGKLWLPPTRGMGECVGG